MYFSGDWESFFYVLKNSSVSIYLCLGLGSFWFYFGTAVYAALGYYFQWNKPKIGYAFCFYIGIWDIGIGELLVMQWFTLRNKEKRCRLGLHRISQRFFRHNGVCGYQVWSLVSSNHGQTTRLLYRRGFGNLASEVLSKIVTPQNLSPQRF